MKDETGKMNPVRNYIQENLNTTWINHKHRKGFLTG